MQSFISYSKKMLVGAVEWVIIQLKFPWGCKTTCVLFVLISFTTRYCKLINAGFLVYKVTWIPMCPNNKTLRMIRAEPNPAEPRPAPDLMEKTWDSLRIVELGWRARTGLWFGPGWYDLPCQGSIHVFPPYCTFRRTFPESATILSVDLAWWC